MATNEEATPEQAGVLAYADGLVIDPASGEILEAPPLKGDRVAYVAGNRHEGKQQTKLWDQAIGGYDAVLARALQEFRQPMVTVDVGGAQLAIASRYQRRTNWDPARLIGVIQEDLEYASDPLVDDGSEAADRLLALAGDLIALIGLVQPGGYRTADVRALDPESRPARWLAAVASQTETSRWIETKPVLRTAPLR